MSDEKIPAEVHATMLWALKRWRTSMQPDDLLRAMLEAPVVQGWLADRSTRPAEPAPEVEVGDGEGAVSLAHLNIGYLYGIADSLAPTHPTRAGDMRQCLSQVARGLTASAATLEAERARADAAVAALLEETGCTSLDDLRDKAAIGASLMERIADLCKPGSRHEHWAPADDPAEIVFDLANEADELRRERDEARSYGQAVRIEQNRLESEVAHWKDRAARALQDRDEAVRLLAASGQCVDDLTSRLDAAEHAEEKARDFGFDHALKILESALGSPIYYAADGSETWEGDTRGTIYNLLRAAGVWRGDDDTLVTAATLDEAVRVAAEDERDRLYDDAQKMGSTIAADWLRYIGPAMLPADRARLRADQRAGDGGEA